MWEEGGAEGSWRRGVQQPLPRAQEPHSLALPARMAAGHGWGLAACQRCRRCRRRRPPAACCRSPAPGRPPAPARTALHPAHAPRPLCRPAGARGRWPRGRRCTGTAPGSAGGRGQGRSDGRIGRLPSWASACCITAAPTSDGKVVGVARVQQQPSAPTTRTQHPPAQQSPHLAPTCTMTRSASTSSTPAPSQQPSGGSSAPIRVHPRPHPPHRKLRRAGSWNAALAATQNVGRRPR